MQNFAILAAVPPDPNDLVTSGGNPIVGLLVILVVVSLLMFLVYRGMDAMLGCCIAACVVALGNSLNVYESMMGTFWTGACNVITSMGFTLILSCLLGQIYLRTGAMDSIGALFQKLFVGNSSGLSMKLRSAYAYFFVALVLCICGMNVYVAVFCLIPMGISIFQKADIPKRPTAGMLAGTLAIACCCPGTPLYTNVLASAFFGTNSTAALVPGLLGVAAMFILNVAWIRSFVKKADKNDQHFVETKIVSSTSDIMPPDRPTPAPTNAGERKLPNPWLSLLPLVLNVILYGLAGWAIEPTLILSIVLALFILLPYFTKEDHRKVPLKTINSALTAGVAAAAPVILVMAAQMGYAAIVSATSAFGMVIGVFSNLPLPSELAFGIFASISGFLSGDSIAGLAFSSNVFLPMAESIGLSAAAMHRIALFAVSILDTIPICGGVIAMLRASGMPHKEGYGPIFRTSVVYVAVGMLVCIVTCMLFPGLT